MWSQQLAQFAALYSDRVYAYNFLADRLTHGYAAGTGSVDELRTRFFDDLEVLSHLRPLVEAGLLVFANPPTDRCAYHSAYELVEAAFGPDGVARLSDAEALLCSEFLAHSRLSVSPQGDGLFDVSYDGPDTLFDHGGGVRLGVELPEALALSLRSREDGPAGPGIPLTNAEAERSGFHRRLAEEAIGGLGFELLCSQLLGTSFVTERRIHVQLLNAISGRADLENRNRLALEHMTSFVPFADELSIDELVEVRLQEPEAFVLYRRALNEAIREYRRAGNDFSGEDARAIYGDVLHPRLTALTRKVEGAREQALKRTGRRTLAWVGALSFGVYAGLVPSSLAQLASAVGLTDVLRQLLEGVLEAEHSNDAARDDEFYFLWQVQRKTQ